jgi:D-beta-D-heptose 7-phosphate kinase / D-beta-D-heptose 1-phosphate adenosyltransferase
VTRIVVVGDVILDRDLVGTAERLCPDAPALVVDEQLLVDRPGGAGLAAALARRHDVEDVTLVGGFADDEAGRRLRSLIVDAGVHIVPVQDFGTTSEKTRVRIDGRSLMRIDRGAPGPLGALPDAAADAIGAADAVLVADYGRGMTADSSLRSLVRAAAQDGVPVVWDPHPRGATPSRGISLVTPNRAEAHRLTGSGPDGSCSLAAVIASARRLRDDWASDAVAVTLGHEGAVVVRRSGPAQMVPVDRALSGGDPCGAGDAFAAAAAAALASGSDIGAAVEHAVAAASRYVHEGGASSIRELPLPESFVDPPPGTSRVTAVREGGGTIVATGGCFDVLHPGHVSTLQRARALGDCLVVLVNDDESVRRLKGPDRPVQQLEDRVAVLRSLGCVDDVVTFDEDTPVAALRRLRPHVFVKGGDYAAETLPESEVLAHWGGAVVTVPFLPGRSTTRILESTARPASAMSARPEGDPHVD